MQQSSAVTSQPLLTQHHTVSGLPKPRSAQTAAGLADTLKLLSSSLGTLLSPGHSYDHNPQLLWGPEGVGQGGFTSSHTKHGHEIHCP